MGMIKDINVAEFADYKVLNALKVNSSSVKVGKVLFEKNARIPDMGYTMHEEDEYVCILKGTIEFGTEEDKYNLVEGDFHFMPENKNHWCKNVQNDNSELMFVMVN